MMHYSRSSICRHVKEVCAAICEELASEYVRFPKTAAAMASNAAGFEQLAANKHGKPRGLPQVIAAVDGSHIGIMNPPKSGPRSPWFNRKGFYSTNMHAACDHLCRFVDVMVGKKGSTHDSAVFKSTPMYQGITAGAVSHIMWAGQQEIQDEKVPYCVIADSAYACETFILPAFKDTLANDGAKRLFNRKHASTRGVIERAFGVLKARWRVLLDKAEISLETVKDVATACCILHNICIDRRLPQPEEEAIAAAQQLYHEVFDGVVEPQVEDPEEQDPVEHEVQEELLGAIPNNRKVHGASARRALVAHLDEA
jgi:hypothetical protein